MIGGSTFWRVAACLFCLSGPVAAEGWPGTLTEDDFAATLHALDAAGHWPENGRLASLGWVDDAGPRRLRAVVRIGADTFEAVIAADERRLVSWRVLTVEATGINSDFATAIGLTFADPRFAAAMSRRGLRPSDMFCLPFFADIPGHPRGMILTCYLRPDGSNFFARPIEGLLAEVDVDAGAVLSVRDDDLAPMLPDGGGYTRAEVAVDAGRGAPARISATGVAWDIWRIGIGWEARAGLVLSDIAVRDGAVWRPVMAEMHLSEVYVPYMDPAAGWARRRLVDAGDYGFGRAASPLRPGIDCPADAAVFPALVHDERGAPDPRPNAYCVFVHQTDAPAWRHYEAPADPVGRAGQELIVRMAATLGNYDYLVDYVFGRDGAIAVRVGATGIVAVKGAPPGAPAPFGSRVAPGLVAPNHAHYFSFRLDIDIDGPANAVQRTTLEALRADGRDHWRPVRSLIETADDGAVRFDPATPTRYRFVNPDSRNAHGYMRGYGFDPGTAVAFPPAGMDDGDLKKNAYVFNTLAVTPADPSLRYAGGEATIGPRSAGLAQAIERGDPIVNRDLVAWVTVGFQHLPRSEDWPVMPVRWKGFALQPVHFFDRNPAINLP